MSESVSKFWLYRVGLYQVDENRHRGIVSMTYLSEDPPVNDYTDFIVLRGAAIRMRRAFGAGDFPNLDHWQTFVEQLWPERQLHDPFDYTPVSDVPTLNPNAQEAAFRIQRLPPESSLIATGRGDRNRATSGSSTSTPAARIGRLAYPILDDRWFTDLPARRHVDMSLQTALDRGANTAWYRTMSSVSRTFTDVIFHRSDCSWTPVDRYELRENPVRIWQRWRTYPSSKPHEDDVDFVPDEVT